MAGLISIGLSGLLSHQSALSTTGNNVANANTPGYSRQETIFETLPSQYGGAGYTGTGVSIDDIRRLNSEFLNLQLRSDTTLNGEQTVLAAEYGRLDNLFGSETTGLNRAMTDFFAAVQDSAESPDSIPQRQLLLSRGEALAQRFQSIAAKLDEHQRSIDQQLTNTTGRINELAKGVADLNLAVSSAPGQAQGNQPNELLDQRDEKLRQLAELVQIQVNRQDSGQVSVAFGNGQSLVSGTYASSLSTDPASPGAIFLSDGSTTRNITGAVNGGRLGGLLDFRQQGLTSAEATLDSIAAGLTDAVNSQHELGLDLDGEIGLIFFSGTSATDIQMDVSDPRDLALAYPVKGETGSQNSGTGSISQGVVSEGFAFDVNEELTIRFSADGTLPSGVRYTVEDSTGEQLTGEFQPGKTNTLVFDDALSPYQGFEFELSGNPALSDTFKIGYNSDPLAGFTASADNRNAVALGDISRQAIIAVGGSDLSLDAAYGSLVTQVGSDTSRAQRGLESSTTLLEQSGNSWQEQSGVNLDEEAGKLIQFQAAYNANAQVVSVARELFDTLLNSFR